MSETDGLNAEQQGMLEAIINGTADTWVTSPTGRNADLLKGWERRGWFVEEGVFAPVLASYRITPAGREALSRPPNN